LLPEETQAKFAAWRVERMLAEEDVPWMTIPKALDEVDELLADASADDARLLGEVREYLLQLAEGNKK